MLLPAAPKCGRYGRECLIPQADAGPQVGPAPNVTLLIQDPDVRLAPFLSLPVSICIHLLEKAMAPHSSTLAWKIPWMEEPGGLQSMGSLRVRHD